jgi:DNA-directed RNA polymerase beta subunit
MQNEINKIIELYFSQPKILYEHLFLSFNQFISEIIPYSLIQENNFFFENIDKEYIYYHGFKCSDIRIKPPTFDNDNEIKFPCNARKNHLNYFATIVGTVQQITKKINSLTGEETIKMIGATEKDIPLANVPIMVKSKYCSTSIKQDLKGECKYDPGGYFIVSGAEKIVMSLEKIIDNKILIFPKKDSSFESGETYIAQINSKKNDWSDNLQILTIKLRKDGVLVLSTSSQLVEIPLFIIMRALGVENDKSITSIITYNLEDIEMMNELRVSVENSCDDEGNKIKTRDEAIQYLLTKLKKNKRFSTDENIANIQKKLHLENIFRRDLLPHLGDDIPKKIMFLGFITNKLMNVILKRQDADDRDALQNKRIETPGVLLGQLFRQNWKKMLNEIGKNFSSKNQSDENPINVVSQIKLSTIEQGIKTALATGIWGMNRTKKGVAQALQRLSWIQGISYLRRILTPSMEDSTSKVTSIRHVSNNQMQLLCLDGDTEIQLINNKIKLMKFICDKDIVVTASPDNIDETPSSIHTVFKKLATNLTEITTISGRSIKATPEHPFLVVKNNKPTWVKTEDMKIGDRIIIRHTERIVPTTNTLVIINDKFIDRRYREELSKFMNVYISQDRLAIIARLLGWINIDIFNDNNNYTMKLDSIDREIFDIDIMNLGLRPEPDQTIKDGLYFLLKHLGTRVKINTIIPNWIMKGSASIKREYLSGFFGNKVNSDSFPINDIYHPTIQEELDLSIKYLSEICLLLKSFNVNASTMISEEAVCLVIENNLDNICQLYDFIGYRYNDKKRQIAAPLIEYLRIIRYQEYDFEDFMKESETFVSVEIKSLTPVEPSMVYDFTTVSDNHSFIANSFCSSNCPVETPEGAKVGIVKHLAMTASITSQNSSQYHVIKSIVSNNNKIKHPYDIDPLTMDQWVKIMLNGDWYGVCRLLDANEIYMFLKQKRRESLIDKYTSILFDIRSKEIRIYFDGGRLIRPLLIVDNNKLNITKEIIEDVNKEMEQIDKTKSWKKLISKYPNIVDYEDIESLNYLLIAENLNRLEDSLEASKKQVEYSTNTKINRYGEYRWMRYTHCDLHRWTMLGTVASNIPFSNHNYALRNIINFSQAKQSIGIYLTSYKDRMDISQILYHPQIPIVTTQGMKYNGCLDLPYGENAIVAVCSYNGYNQEDSIIFNQSAIDRGIFRAESLKKEHSEIEKNPSTSQDDVFTKPDRNKVTGMKQGSYEKLNDKGYIPEETEIDNEDIIIGKISPIQPTGNNNKVYKDNSKIYKSNVKGVIDRVHTGIYNAEGYEMYNIRIRMERIPIPGDKFTCYDNSHDVLTTDGWINIKDITMNHRVASLVDNNLVYQNPIAIQSYDYNGSMYRVETDNVSLCVTPNHRMLVKNDSSYQIELAKDIVGLVRTYKKNVDNITINMDSNFVYNLDSIEGLCVNGIVYEIRTYLHLYGLSLSSSNIENKLRNMGMFPDWVWNLTPKLCRILLSGMLYKSNFYTTCDSNMKDVFMRLCLHANYSSNIIIKVINNVTTYYCSLTENETTVNINSKDDSMIDFNGKVYCCSVFGEGIIYVRRNNISCWSGQSRHGQKGTIGIVYPQKDMPFTESGIVPDLILNPHGYPRRMSIAHFIECMASKEAAETGHFVDGTPFCDYDVKQLPIALRKLGYSASGTETMYCGISGRKIDVEIFIGPIYMMRLKHMVQDKVHGRARGPKQALTRQPLEGRSRDGGLKIGEMEKDAMVAHGMGQFLKERLMETSDIIKVYICDDCGQFASKVIDKEYYKCKGCQNSTKISAVVIPYACKLLFQELTSVNILPRIRTEKSIFGDEL